MKTLRAMLADETGTTVAEYAIISGMIGFTALVSVVVLGIKFMVLMVS